MASAVESLAVKLTGDTGDFDKKIDAANQKWGGFTDSLNGAGQKMKGAGTTLSAGVTAPLLGIGTAAVMTVAGFDDSMSQVQAISGATGDELESLRGLAKDLGSTTAFSASQAADAMGYLALAGWDTNQIMQATPQMLSLASAGAMDLATAADIVSDTMSAFQMDATQAGTASDIFAAAQAKSNTNVTMLGEAMKYAGANANAAGMDLAETATVLGVLADSGIKGSGAGTSLNAMLRDMTKNAEDGAIAIGNTSVSIFDAEGNFRDFGSIMGDVERATYGMSDAQRDAALRNVFQEESLRGVNVMLATGSERYAELEGAIRSSEGTAASMAATMEDNVGGSFRELKSQTEGVLIQLGEELAPLIRDPIIPLIQQFGDKISGLIEWFSGLDSQTQTWILTAIGIVAALGPLLVIAGTVATAISALIPVVTAIGGALAVLTGPIGLVVLAVAGLAAAWATDFGGIRTKTQEFWGWITESWPGWMGSLKQGWEGFSNWWQSDTSTKIAGVRQGWEGFSSWFQTNTQTALGAVRGFWETHSGSVQGIVSGGLNTVRGAYETQMGIVRGVVQAGVQFMQGDWQGGLQTLQNTAQTTLSNLQSTFRTGVDGVASILRMFGWEGTGEDIMRGIQNGIENGMEWVRNAARQAAQAALNAAKSLLGISSPSKVFEEEIGAEIPPGMGAGITRAIPVANRAVQDAINDMIGSVPSMANAMPLAGQGGGAPIQITVHVEGRDATYERGRQVGAGIVDELRSRGLR